MLYIFEPVVMIYLLPPGILRALAPATGGPILQPFRWFLVLVTGLLLMFGLLLLLNPEFAATRWPWELNGLDARIVAAWALGWAVWCGTMAFATDWDEIRTAARLFVLLGIALTIVSVLFRDEFLPERGSAVAFTIVIAGLTILMAGFHWLQERRRPTPELNGRAADALVMTDVSDEPRSQPEAPWSGEPRSNRGVRAARGSPAGTARRT